ncbi:MAG TPA: cyclodeaminase/cyclohydrolase family protein [Candidatus Limnocylindria bacterium]|nr:cyclodeaminase/cyclohydrolase family protein [Candidatus Limnocylindria bacterium]
MDARLTNLPTRELIERLATSDPIPGGGSASALAGAMGAALVHMVVALTANRPAAAGNEEILAEIGSEAVAAQSELLRLAELDAAAYDAVIRARRLPKDTELERQSRDTQAHQATREATLAPLETVRRAADVLGLAERLAPIGNRNAVSDVGVGALLAVTAMRGAAFNVRINLPYLADDDPLREDAGSQLYALLDRIDERERDVRHAVEARLG